MEDLKRPKPFLVYRSRRDLGWCVEMLDIRVEYVVGGWNNYRRIYVADTHREAIDCIDMFVRDYTEEDTTMKRIRMGCALEQTDMLRVKYIEVLELIEVKVTEDGDTTAMTLTLDGLRQLIDKLDDLAAEIEYDEYVKLTGDKEDER